jgi:Zn-dependent metalloprotease
MPRSGLFRPLPFFLIAGPLLASAPGAAALAAAGDQALAILQSLQPRAALGPSASFAVRQTVPDPVLGGVDVRVDQYHQGVRVMGGETIVHLREGRLRALTHPPARPFTLDARPSLTPSEALAMAVADLAPKGPFARPPSVQLVIARMQLGPGEPVLRDALVYRIHTELENGAAETAHTDFLIDAHTGAVAKRWNSLHTRAEVGVGRSQYSGRVALDTTCAGKHQYELRDSTRGKGGNTVVNLNHGTSDDQGSIYTSTRNTWGDGRNYDGGSTRSANGETAAVDAAYGLQETWDYYRKVLGRDGIDGKGTATTLRVHYDVGYDNAFWSDGCFCMTFGDGDHFKSLEAMDVIGHEVSHGVCAATANLEYFGESGGLNESNSDIMGTMVEFYARAGHDGVIGDRGANWLVGEQLETRQHPAPIRYMYKPSKDGRSPDAWNCNLADLNVHRSSGPMNRCFFFLSHGASADKTSDRYTTLLPKGMAGIGNDKAARIWYRAMTTYLTSLDGYAEARDASVAAARDLYGAGGREEAAVCNAFHGIKIGAPWQDPMGASGPRRQDEAFVGE